MKNLFFILLFLICQTSLFAQINPSKLRKINPNDKFELILLEENKKLDSSIFKTDIWISDEYDNQYDFDYGIIINKKTILEKLTKFNNVDLRFLIRIILGHEKMHAKQYSKFTKEELDKYLRLVSKEQRLRDETQADLAAGYNAFDIENYEDAKYAIKIIREFQQKGFDEEPNLNESEYMFGKALRNNEIIAFEVFFSMGENQNYVTSHASSYQRALAIEMGIKAASVTRFFDYVSSQWKTFPENEKILYNELIEKLENDIQFKCVKDYFYKSWSFWTADKILNFHQSLNKFINFKILNISKDSINSQIIYKTSVSNTNKIDSILINYSILLTVRPSTEYPTNTILGAINKMLKLAPNETKITLDSIDIGISKMLSDNMDDQLAFKLVYPGQLGSLYYTTLLNNKNSTKYYDDNQDFKYRDCKKCEANLEDLLQNLSGIQNNFRSNDVENYIHGIDFQNINTDYISYSIFIRNRPFDLMVFPDKRNPILKTIVYTNQNQKLIKDFMRTIYGKLENQKNINSQLTQDKNNNPCISLNNLSEKNIGSLEIIYDGIFKEYQIELKLLK
jgi:hypothetical protein